MDDTGFTFDVEMVRHASAGVVVEVRLLPVWSPVGQASADRIAAEDDPLVHVDHVGWTFLPSIDLLTEAIGRDRLPTVDIDGLLAELNGDSQLVHRLERLTRSAGPGTSVGVAVGKVRVDNSQPSDQWADRRTRPPVPRGSSYTTEGEIAEIVLRIWEVAQDARWQMVDMDPMGDTELVGLLDAAAGPGRASASDAVEMMGRAAGAAVAVGRRWVADLAAVDKVRVADLRDHTGPDDLPVVPDGWEPTLDDISGQGRAHHLERWCASRGLLIGPRMTAWTLAESYRRRLWDDLGAVADRFGTERIGEALHQLDTGEATVAELAGRDGDPPTSEDRLPAAWRADRLARGRSASERRVAARSDLLDEESLRLLAADTRSVTVRRTVAERDDLPADVLLDLAADDDGFVRQSIAEQELLPDVVAAALVARSDPEDVRTVEAVASSTADAQVQQVCVDWAESCGERWAEEWVLAKLANNPQLDGRVRDRVTVLRWAYGTGGGPSRLLTV